MEKEKIKKITEIAKQKEIVRIVDVHTALGVSKATALLYLLEMEILGILEKFPYTNKNDKYQYKIWRLKQNTKK